MAERKWLVPLTAAQLQLLRSGLDSERYYRSPEVLRNSGYALDPEDLGIEEELYVDDDEGGTPWREYVQEIDDLDELLLQYEHADREEEVAPRK